MVWGKTVELLKHILPFIESYIYLGRGLNKVNHTAPEISIRRWWVAFSWMREIEMTDQTVDPEVEATIFAA